MKLLKKLSNTYSLSVFLVALPLLFLLVSFFVSVKGDSLFVFSFRIPLSVNNSHVVSVSNYLNNFLIVLTTYLTLLFFVDKNEKRECLIFGFGAYLFFIIYISIFISLGFVNFLKPLLVFFANLIIIYGFLLIFEKVSKSSLLAAVVIMLLQLAGGGLTYLYDFSEMLPKKIALVISIIYNIVPIYQKTILTLQTNNFSLIFTDLIVSLAFILFYFYSNTKSIIDV